MVGRNRFRRCGVLIAFQGGVQFFRGRHIVPLIDQFAVFAENENPKEIRTELRTELTGYCAVEIWHAEDVATSIARNFQFVVAGLEPASLAITPSPHYRAHQQSNRLAVRLFERHDSDHSKCLIAQTRIRCAISDETRFIDAGFRRQSNCRHVTIRSGERISINVGEIDSIIFADRQVGTDRHREKEKRQTGEKNLCLACVHD